MSSNLVGWVEDVILHRHADWSNAEVAERIVKVVREEATAALRARVAKLEAALRFLIEPTCPKTERAIIEMTFGEYKKREDELLALRARVAKLEAALEEAYDVLAEYGFSDRIKNAP